MIQRIVLASLVMAALMMFVDQLNAQSPGIGGRFARVGSNSNAWHGGHYYLPTGQPTALVVPPNATMQSNYSWGVSQNTMTPVYSQFQGLPPTGAGGGLFRATPIWPSHTNQFGVYPVRGPW